MEKYNKMDPIDYYLKTRLHIDKMILLYSFSTSGFILTSIFLKPILSKIEGFIPLLFMVISTILTILSLHYSSQILLQSDRDKLMIKIQVCSWLGIKFFIHGFLLLLLFLFI